MPRRRPRSGPLRWRWRAVDRPSRTGRQGSGSPGHPLLRSQAPLRSLETDPDLTGRAIGEPDPGRAAPQRTSFLDAASGILVILAVALAFRFIIAYLLPGS